jgi:hypothetical protein
LAFLGVFPYNQFMSYIPRILADVPYAVWSVDSSTFTDSGGSSRAAELITPANYKASNPLVVGSGKSVIVGTSTAARFFFPGFQPGKEERAFTLECWFSIINDTDDFGILSHDGDLDGIWFDGKSVHFTTTYIDASSADTSYIIRDNEAYHVVGVHTESRNSLYVNGILVDEVDISEDQQLLAYASITNANYLYAGQNSGTASVIIDTPAVYAYAIEPRKVYSHFIWGRDHQPLGSIISDNNGYYLELTDNTADIYISKTWDTDEEWAEGITPNVIVADGTIFPNLDSNGDPEEGQWVGTVLLNTLDPLHDIDGAKIYWFGDGDFTVSVALDGTTFGAVTNGSIISGIAAGYLTEGESIDVMVEFGPDADAYVDRLTIVTYKTKTIKTNMSIRTAEFDGNVILAPEHHEPIEDNTSRGARFFGGKIDITEDATEEPANIAGLEFWIKFDSLGSAMTILDYRTGATTGAPRLRWTGSAIDSTGFDDVFVNGSATLPTFQVGVWYHFVLSLDTGVNLDLRLGQSYLGTEPLSAQLGHLSFLQPTQVVADALSMYSDYFGINLNQIDEPNMFTIAEDSPSYNLYTYDWSITSAG